MFSQTSEYALRAVVFLAMSPGRAFTTHEIAESTKVSAPYLSKVLQQLVRAGLVKSQRGIGGGFVLASRPAATSILQVVNAVDPIKRITTCPLGLEAHGDNLCALHRKLDEVSAEIEHAFETTTLADLLASAPLCDPAGGKLFRD
jgi:Rrf2 family transcriptional regulator, nitric oxide-sensitive transcriptional repressor